MDNTDILLKSYYDIDGQSKIIIFKDSEHETLTNYITETASYVLNDSTNCQRYKLKRDTNEVFAIIKKCLQDETDQANFDENSELIAQKLLESEIRFSRGAAQISSGGLIQSLIKNEEGYYYILMKNEFFTGVNRNSMEIIEAFLYDKKKKTPLRICIFEIKNIDGEFEVYNIYIDDSIQKSHAVHWYDDFLDLDKCNNDEVNTDNAVDNIINVMDKKISDRAIFTDLRNETISYFRTNENFDLEEFKETIKKICDSEEIDKVFDKIDKIADSKKGFDKRFSIDPKGIKKRLVTRKFHPLKSKTILLSIEGKINRNEIYVVHEKEKEEYFLKIRTDDENTIKELLTPPVEQLIENNPELQDEIS